MCICAFVCLRKAWPFVWAVCGLPAGQGHKLYFVAHPRCLNRSCRTPCRVGNCTGLWFRRESWEGAVRQKKNSVPSLCHLSHTQSQQSHLPHALHPSAGVANGRGLGHLLPALLRCVWDVCTHVLLCLSMYSEGRVDNGANKCTPCTMVYLVN